MKNERKIYCVSDTHFGHKNMVEWALRPVDFEQKLWEAIEAIPADGILLHLGDVALGSDALTHERLQKIPCKKWLVRGNHDNHSFSWYLNNGWDFVGDQIILSIYGKSFLFSHMPQPKMDGIEKNIHGHMHGGKSHGFPSFYDTSYHMEITPEVVGYNLVKLQ